MQWLLILVAAVLASEAFLRLPLMPAIRRANRAAARSVRTLRSARISDHWKERMLPVYALTIARNSVLFFALLCLAVLPALLLGVLLPGGITAWLALLIRPLNLLLLCGLSVLYLVIRTRLARG